MFECMYSGNPVPGIIKISYFTFYYNLDFYIFIIFLKMNILILIPSLSLLINIDNF